MVLHEKHVFHVMLSICLCHEAEAIHSASTMETETQKVGHGPAAQFAELSP